MRSLFFYSLALLSLSACGLLDRSTLAPGEAKAREVEARFTQTGRLDPHTEVQVTQWSPELRHAEAFRGQGHDPQRRKFIEERVRRWDQAAQGYESFLVLLEIRDTDAGSKDPRVDIKRWSFSLRDGQGRTHRATQIELLTKDRFPAHAGGAHWRIGARVDFPATRAGSALVLELQAPDEDVPKQALRANLPQRPARFDFRASAQPKSSAPVDSLTAIRPSR